MKFKFDDNNRRYVLDSESSAIELEQMLPFEYMLLVHDLPDRYSEMSFCVAKGYLYGYEKVEDKWYFFDHSVRRWTEANNPYQE